VPDIFYVIQADIELNEDIVDREREKLGRFVLASNDLEIDDEPCFRTTRDSSRLNVGSGS